MMREELLGYCEDRVVDVGLGKEEARLQTANKSSDCCKARRKKQK